MTAELTKINAAIRDCLDQCYGNKAPLTWVAAYLEHLRRSEDWSEEEVKEVETAVLKMLSVIAMRPPHV